MAEEEYEGSDCLKIVEFNPMRDRSFRMSNKPISPLRQRMIDDMTARRVKEKVQKDNVRHVRTFAAFLGRSPDTATSEDLRRFQVHLAKQQIGVATINAAIAALRFSPEFASLLWLESLFRSFGNRRQVCGFGGSVPSPGRAAASNGTRASRNRATAACARR